MADLKTQILAHHTFTFPSLNPGSGSNQQPYLRFLMFIKKRPDISDEKFHEWWKTVHADLAVAVESFGGHCVRYVQLHQTAEHKKEAEKYGLSVLEYDGVGEMHVKNLEDWLEFQKSPAFAEKLLGDGPNFMDGTLKVMVGYDNLIYGSKIETSGGTDGILPGDRLLKQRTKDSKL
ncbi:hypothetical protein EK21DRAFT_56094 [Setomelanomma holmii]|uniref:EthD domain-containing protein n=1 Tax=Setomelanomma holmii TaxID=210430 RepID=A0A9P4HGH7_9PLEO|nr:hypothetical protein EK21DRAFT_56094 [Setomelanomma holmii]